MALIKKIKRKRNNSYLLWFAGQLFLFFAMTNIAEIFCGQKFDFVGEMV